MFKICHTHTDTVGSALTKSRANLGGTDRGLSSVELVPDALDAHRVMHMGMKCHTVNARQTTGRRFTQFSNYRGLTELKGLGSELSRLPL